MASLHGKRLIIFGCGYLGTALARAALAAGARVEALTRNPEKAADLRTLGLTKVVVADLSAADWHPQIKGGADYVVNCVSSAGGPGGYQRSYVAGQRSVLAWAMQPSGAFGTFVYTSSTSVYPQGNGALVDETSPAAGATPNGRTIRESETVLEGAAPGAGRRWFILRLAGLYGPARHHLLDQLRTGATTLGGSGAHRLNLVHRDDAVAAVQACLTAPPEIGHEIFNVADNAPALRSEVVGWLAERLGRPVPGFDGLGGARRDGEPMPDRRISSDKIQRVLGWRPQFPDYRAGYETLLSP